MVKFSSCDKFSPSYPASCLRFSGLAIKGLFCPCLGILPQLVALFVTNGDFVFPNRDFVLPQLVALFVTDGDFVLPNGDFDLPQLVAFFCHRW